MTTLAYWDLEIAYNLPLLDGAPPDDIWQMYPFGISVGATAYSDDNDVNLWYGIQLGGTPAPAWDYEFTRWFILHLLGQADQGVKLFGWNSTGFDWQLLARLVPDLHHVCVDLCKQSFDPCFQVLCQRGYPVGLNSATKALGLQQKEMDGAGAPTLWAAGMYQEVMDYVKGDVLRLKGIVEQIARRKGLLWEAKNGVAFEPFQKFLTVERCLQLSQPDISWMTEPIDRERSISWW